MNDFDLKKYLIENKITSNSKLLSENSSQTIEYKGKKYYIEDPEGKERVFAYSDPQLQQVVKVNGKTLMFKTKDIGDSLVKEGSFDPLDYAEINYPETIRTMDDDEIGEILTYGTPEDVDEYLRYFYHRTQ